MDDAAQGVIPAARINKAAGMIRELGFDLLLVGHSFLLVLEGTVKEAVFRSVIRRHDAPTEVIAVTDGAALKGCCLNA